MKNLITLLLLIVGSVSHASGVVYIESWSASEYPDISVSQVNFPVDSETLSAHLKYTSASRFFVSDDIIDPFFQPNFAKEILINGLSFNAQRSQVIYRDLHNRVTVCAFVQRSEGLFSSNYQSTPTGRCGVRTRPITVPEGAYHSRPKERRIGVFFFAK